MNRIAILLILIISSLNIFSQTLQIDWQSCLGGFESDYAMDMVELDNGFLILGNTFSNDGDVSFLHGENDLWLVRIDSTGSILFEKSFGGSEGDGSQRIFAIDQNEFYLLGGAVSSDGDISSDPYPNSLDFWILKIDIDGNIIWDKIVGGNGGDHLWTGTVTNDGGIVAMGWSGSEYGDVSINYGLYDIWMIKLSSEGEIEWDFTLGTDWQDYGQAIIQTSDGGFLVGGSSKLTGGGNLDCECKGQADGVLIKMDADRNIEWQKCYGGSDYDLVWSVMELSDGYIFVGGAGSNDGDISGYHADGDIWVVKIDSLGNIIWQKCLGGYRSEYANIVYKTETEDFIIFGSTRSNDGDVSGNHSMSDFDYDIWMVKLNSDGELILQQCIGGAGSEKLYFGVVKKSDNNFVIAGQSDYGPSYDVACTPHGGYGDEDFWVFEIDLDDTTGILDTPSTQGNVKVYPSPAREYVVFENQDSISRNQDKKYITQEGQDSEIVILDVFGKEVERLQVKSKKTVWDTRQVQNGIYFYRLEMEGKRYGGKVVVQK